MAWQAGICICADAMAVQQMASASTAMDVTKWTVGRDMGFFLEDADRGEGMRMVVRLRKCITCGLQAALNSNYEVSPSAIQ